MPIKETIPCLFDIRQNCPETCNLHTKSKKWFEDFVNKRNTFNETSYSSQEILEQIRKEAETTRLPYISGLELVVDGDPETLDCKQKDVILESIK